jgi:uncharacterized membrane protein YidH (DUF202 family)
MTSDQRIEPDDPGLATERTALAWSRTALTLAAIGALLVHLAAEGDVSVPAYALGGSAIAAGAAAWRDGQRSYWANRKALATGAPVARPGTLRALGVFSVLLSIGALVLVAIAA